MSTLHPLYVNCLYHDGGLTSTAFFLYHVGPAARILYVIKLRFRRALDLEIDQGRASPSAICRIYYHANSHYLIYHRPVKERYVNDSTSQDIPL